MQDPISCCNSFRMGWFNHHLVLGIIQIVGKLIKCHSVYKYVFFHAEKKAGPSFECYLPIKNRGRTQTLCKHETSHRAIFVLTKNYKPPGFETISIDGFLNHIVDGRDPAIHLGCETNPS